MEHPTLTLRSAAHDIRGYLASASLAAEGLGEHVDEKVALHAERISKAIDQIAYICDTDLNETEKPETITRLNRGDIEGMLEDITHLIGPVYEDRAGHPKMDVLVSSGTRLVCSKTRLFRIIYNLTVNAAHAIRASTGSQITIRVSQGCGNVCFSISDDGPGLPEHIIGHLYPRIDRPPAMGANIGFGLMTAVSLAREMGGRIRLLRSSPNGTEFCLMLPDRPI
ncbi:HAMP domain-containing sensor histidine kinase [uncultured Tateyamaria sp.]|uniref:sensor histidine kinase n=1 Tax=uncultured Tateyamaria sp. TaxID=455651 RepID=UPI0026118CC3|nr:HAMP domain-containing sensor histidine kinase [uncultured Tateyamaria sp.]